MNGKSIRSAVVVMIGVALVALIISLVNPASEALAFSPVKRHLAQRIRSYTGVTIEHAGYFEFTTEASENGFIITDLFLPGVSSVLVEANGVTIFQSGLGHCDCVPPINLESGIPVLPNATIRITIDGGGEAGSGISVFVSGYVF